MADQYSSEGSSTGNVSGESSDSIVQLNIKTLDSQIYSFQVDKNVPVSSFKEKIANEIGIPVGQQRLIFRGRVLKDDHLLSEYHVENGHTLHLVERQPAQSQPSSGTGSGETTGDNGNRGSDAGTGNPRNRVGQISHSVVLGTFNVGDQGEGMVPDLSRVIGAVLNSIGLGGQTTSVGTGVPQYSNLAPQGNETEGTHGNVGGQPQVGNQAQSGQAFPSQPFQSLPQVVQIPMAAAAVPVPSLQVPIPDSLSTLSEFMNRMEHTLSQNGYQPSSTNTGNLPRVELPTNAQGLRTPESLSIVLRHAERLLSGHAVAALSHIAGRLEQEGSSSDPSIRGQIQTESMQFGLAMQHLGALLLELGRTILTLRMGQSPAEYVLNAGPAVYISPSGPNPIMVQPFPLQTSSLFGGSVPQSNPVTFGPVGIGNAPRHINIHIHAGTSLAPIVSAVGARASNVEGMQGEHRSAAGSGDSGATRVLPMRNVFATAVPSRPSGVASSGVAQPGLGVSVSQRPADSVSLSSVISEVNSRIRNFVGNLQGESMVLSGQAETSVQNSSVESGARSDVGIEQPNTTTVNSVNRVGESGASVPGCTPESEGQKLGFDQLSNNDASTGLKDVSDSSGSSLSCLSGGTAAKSEDVPENALRFDQKHDTTEGAKAVPIGLGLGGLERKRRGMQQKKVTGGDSGTTSASVDENQRIRTSGQQILQSLASHSSAVSSMNANERSQGQLPSAVGQVMDSRPLGAQGSDGQIDMANLMSQVLQSPALNGLVTGVSEQTGVVSPDVFRNMLQQLTQSPQMRNTVNQIVQQVDTQDLGNMFAGLGRGQGGGLDLPRMFQQMMPIVSQALSGRSTPSQLFSAVEAEPPSRYNERLSSDDKQNEQNFQIDLQPVAQRIEHLNPPGDVFRSVAENAVQLSGSGSDSRDLVDELCSEEDLANEYMEMLRRNIWQRLPGDSGQDNL
ncbi:ubiquitin-like domain-containing protein CIP73 isoform X2 [Corylus avellana]|uniref:ubiquitin-like domain-containing protein CIP73 isoform X2 n=1 Tax=Corylus avellana TaxID=13451 RepID=UPI00286C6256|nr:ubiquitin-like domain-containing protein CIP73 isoform X2 [Corylus avellana]